MQENERKAILKETAKVGVAALCLALIAGYTSQLVRPCEKLQRCPGTQGTCPDGQSCNWKLEFSVPRSRTLLCACVDSRTTGPCGSGSVGEKKCNRLVVFWVEKRYYACYPPGATEFCLAKKCEILLSDPPETSHFCCDYLSYSESECEVVAPTP